MGKYIDNELYLSSGDVAVLTGCNPRTVLRWYKNGEVSIKRDKGSKETIKLNVAIMPDGSHYIPQKEALSIVTAIKNKENNLEAKTENVNE
jgi:hypothetical protein